MIKMGTFSTNRGKSDQLADLRPDDFLRRFVVRQLANDSFRRGGVLSVVDHSRCADAIGDRLQGGNFSRGVWVKKLELRYIGEEIGLVFV